MIQQAQRLPYYDSCRERIIALRAEIVRRSVAREQLRSEARKLRLEEPFASIERWNELRLQIGRAERQAGELEDEINRLNGVLEAEEERCSESDARAPAEGTRSMIQNIGATAIQP